MNLLEIKILFLVVHLKFSKKICNLRTNFGLATDCLIIGEPTLIIIVEIEQVLEIFEIMHI